MVVLVVVLLSVVGDGVCMLYVLAFDSVTTILAMGGRACLRSVVG